MRNLAIVLLIVSIGALANEPVQATYTEISLTTELPLPHGITHVHVELTANRSRIARLKIASEAAQMTYGPENFLEFEKIELNDLYVSYGITSFKEPSQIHGFAVCIPYGEYYENVASNPRRVRHILVVGVWGEEFYVSVLNEPGMGDRNGCGHH